MLEIVDFSFSGLVRMKITFLKASVQPPPPTDLFYIVVLHQPSLSQCVSINFKQDQWWMMWEENWWSRGRWMKYWCSRYTVMQERSHWMRLWDGQTILTHKSSWRSGMGWSSPEVSYILLTIQWRWFKAGHWRPRLSVRTSLELLLICVYYCCKGLHFSALLVSLCVSPRPSLLGLSLCLGMCLPHTPAFHHTCQLQYIRHGFPFINCQIFVSTLVDHLLTSFSASMPATLPFTPHTSTPTCSDYSHPVLHPVSGFSLDLQCATMWNYWQEI